MINNLTIILLALCSILYELILIYVSSTIHGDRMISYAIIMGIYLLALGYGSYLSENLIKRYETYKILKYAEFSIATLGLISLPLIYLTASNYSIEYVWIVEIIFVSLIGLISGMEIPLLSKLFGSSISKVLAYDYLGAFIATLIFVFVFLTYTNIFESIAIVLIVNLTTLLIVSIQLKRKNKIEVFVLIVFLIIVSIMQYNNISKIIGDNYYNSIIYEKEHCQDRGCKVETIASFATPFQHTSYVKLDYKDVNISTKCIYIDKDVQTCSNWQDSYHSYIATIPLSLINSKDKSV
jgi:spermidine synthase